jgi:hypothetical protein
MALLALLTSSPFGHLERPTKSIGLKGGSVEVTYLHSMKTRYPSEFVGANNKSQITNLTTIEMLESMDAWKGNGLGGTGVKV